MSVARTRLCTATQPHGGPCPLTADTTPPDVAVGNEQDAKTNLFYIAKYFSKFPAERALSWI